MKNSLLILTICLSLVSCSIFKFAKKSNIDEKSFHKADYLTETHPISKWLKDFEPTKTVIIGPEREYKSLYQFFNENYQISNVYVLVEEGSYYSDEEIWIDGQTL
jgi:stalled ribosome rescue protein Dom34